MSNETELKTMNAGGFCLVLFLCVLLSLCNNALGNNGHEPIDSNRKKMYTLLYNNGCTNRVVAHYIVQAAIGPAGISASMLRSRLSGLVVYDSAQVQRWYVLMLYSL